ncbi:transglutaminase-like domain-containing protein [Amaricoccus sp.]|uniref:transglutaminase-like domain-containing protein n=1 Tax=Amaricoccus sp. TaxID=1872485 RepID=UPI001B57F90A|nr:transglutaminase-like domain-containing protein [Amaricoccus sp.]MBP7001763.1 transglutaminase domain-containing protein [Amaricoccus sp.]
MRRRDFLAASAACGAMLLAPRTGRAAAGFDPRPGPWRSFAVTTKIDVIDPGAGAAQAWVPLPSVDEPDWSAPEGDDWDGNAATAEVVVDPVYGARILHATFAPGEPAPRLEVTSRFRSRDRGQVLDGPAPRALSEADRRLFLAATELLPTDGIVRETAQRITAGATDEVAKARAIYEWVVENSRRKAEVRGCGLGDVASMLAMGDLSGKCADLNALFVALARASGLPARDLYGLRVAPSAFGYKSLGAGSEVVTKAQHCRAEVWLDAHGWTPADPADVRKVVLEEPPGENPLGSEKVAAARAALFGAWEGNWMAYNDAHDLTLPGSEHRLAFLMYPQVEVAGVLRDCLAADTVAYAITAQETAV